MDLYQPSPGDTPQEAIRKLLETAKKRGERVQLEMRNFRIIADPEDTLDVLERQLAAASLERDMQSYVARQQGERILRLERDLSVARNTIQLLKESQRQVAPQRKAFVRTSPTSWVCPASIEQVELVFGKAVLHLSSGERVTTATLPRALLQELGMNAKQAAAAVRAAAEGAAAARAASAPCMPPLEIRVLRYMLLHDDVIGTEMAEALGERPEAVYQVCLQSSYLRRAAPALDGDGSSKDSKAAYWTFRSAAAREEAQALYGGPLDPKERK